MEGYLYISYCPNGDLKDHKLYQCLEELRKERGIGISPEVLKRNKVGKWSHRLYDGHGRSRHHARKPHNADAEGCN